MAQRVPTPGIGSDFTDIASDMVSGASNAATFNSVVIPQQQPTFVKMIVLDVISDPNTEILDEDRKKELLRYGVANIGLIEELPRNTIVAKKVGEETVPIFVFPFFPSHLALPCKPGECVWVMVEKPGTGSLEIAYWFCRVVEPHSADDVNHSHPNRSTEPSLRPNLKEIEQREKKGTATTGEDVWHEMRNGPVVNVGEDRKTSLEVPILKGASEDIFERLITETRAAGLSHYEAIPRFRKRPGDVVLEGSNNTLIVLGIERSGSIDMPPTGAGGLPLLDAGSIDIVVGRGQTESTLGKVASTTSFKDAKGKTKGTELKKEINKSPDVLSKSEGDPDMRNDRSRIVVSQRTNVDGNFGVDIYNGQQGMMVSDHPQGEPGIVIKSDKVRLIARSDVEIIVTGYETKTISDTKAIKDEKDVTKDGRINWASITVKSNGDIVFTPSDDGYIRLGGPDANLGVVCTDTPVVTTKGGVSGKPLVTTMGGKFGGSKASSDGLTNSKALGASGQGKFANKVLVK